MLTDWNEIAELLNSLKGYAQSVNTVSRNSNQEEIWKWIDSRSEAEISKMLCFPNTDNKLQKIEEFLTQIVKATKDCTSPIILRHGPDSCLQHVTNELTYKNSNLMIDTYRTRHLEKTLIMNTGFTLKAKKTDFGGHLCFHGRRNVYAIANNTGRYIELMNLLKEMSLGMCFSKSPSPNTRVLIINNSKSTSPTQSTAVSGSTSFTTVEWLKNLPYFTLGQLLASLLEMSIWEAYNRRNCLSVDHHKASSMICEKCNFTTSSSFSSTLTPDMINTNFSLKLVRALRSPDIHTLISIESMKICKQLFHDPFDEFFLSMFKLVYKRLPTTKHFTKDTCSLFERSRCITRLWFFDYLSNIAEYNVVACSNMTNGSSSSSSSSSGDRTEQLIDDDFLLDLLCKVTCLPLFEQMTPRNEFQAELVKRLEAIGCELLVADLLLEEQQQQQCKQQQGAHDHLANKKKDKDREKKKRKKLKPNPKLMCSDSTAAKGDGQGLSLEGSTHTQLNIGLHPYELQESHIESTALYVFVGRVVEDILARALELAEPCSLQPALTSSATATATATAADVMKFTVSLPVLLKPIAQASVTPSLPSILEDTAVYDSSRCFSPLPHPPSPPCQSTAVTTAAVHVFSTVTAPDTSVISTPTVALVATTTLTPKALVNVVVPGELIYFNKKGAGEGASSSQQMSAAQADVFTFTSSSEDIPLADNSVLVTNKYQPPQQQQQQQQQQQYVQFDESQLVRKQVAFLDRYTSPEIFAPENEPMRYFGTSNNEYRVAAGGTGLLHDELYQNFGESGQQGFWRGSSHVMATAGMHASNNAAASAVYYQHAATDNNAANWYENPLAIHYFQAPTIDAYSNHARNVFVDIRDQNGHVLLTDSYGATATADVMFQFHQMQQQHQQLLQELSSQQMMEIEVEVFDDDMSSSTSASAVEGFGVGVDESAIELSDIIDALDSLPSSAHKPSLGHSTPSKSARSLPYGTTASTSASASADASPVKTSNDNPLSPTLSIVTSNSNKARVVSQSIMLSSSSESASGRDQLLNPLDSHAVLRRAYNKLLIQHLLSESARAVLLNQDAMNKATIMHLRAMSLTAHVPVAVAFSSTSAMQQQQTLQMTQLSRSQRSYMYSPPAKIDTDNSSMSSTNAIPSSSSSKSNHFSLNLRRSQNRSGSIDATDSSTALSNMATIKGATHSNIESEVLPAGSAMDRSGASDATQDSSADCDELAAPHRSSSPPVTLTPPSPPQLSVPSAPRTTLPPPPQMIIPSFSMTTVASPPQMSVPASPVTASSSAPRIAVSSPPLMTIPFSSALTSTHISNAVSSTTSASALTSAARPPVMKAPSAITTKSLASFSKSKHYGPNKLLASTQSSRPSSSSIGYCNSSNVTHLKTASSGKGDAVSEDGERGPLAPSRSTSSDQLHALLPLQPLLRSSSFIHSSRPLPSKSVLSASSTAGTGTGTGSNKPVSEDNISTSSLPTATVAVHNDGSRTSRSHSNAPAMSVHLATSHNHSHSHHSNLLHHTATSTATAPSTTTTGLSYAYSNTTLEEYSSSPLAKEIQCFVRQVDLSVERNRQAKFQVFQRMKTTVQNLWPRSQVKIFGSFVTGLALPSSDVDMVICLPKVHMEARPEAPGVLEVMGNAIKQTWQSYLASTLAKEEWVIANSIKIIGNTKIPVLKVQTRPESFQSVGPISLDISFEGPGHRGLETNKMIASLMKTYPSLRPIVLVLKCFLHMKSLCESFTGGLSSYSLLLLVVRYLQEIDAKSAVSVSNNINTSVSSGNGSNVASSAHVTALIAKVQDLGALLLGFLRFFGEKWDPRAIGISIKRNVYFSRQEVTSALHSQFNYQPPPPLYNPTNSSTTAANAASAAATSFSSEYNHTLYSQNLLETIDRRHSFQGGRMAGGGGTDRAGERGGRNPMIMGNNLIGMPSTTIFPFKFDPVFVEDPLENSNNVARNCFRILQVQKCWIEAAERVTFRLSEYETSSCDNTNNSSSLSTNAIDPNSNHTRSCSYSLNFKLLDVLVGNGYTAVNGL